jgi:hypothetical protein
MQCKKCRVEITHEQAAASLFDLQFLPGPDGRPVTHRHVKHRVAGIGPLCEKCMAKQKTLPIKKRE